MCPTRDIQDGPGWESGFPCSEPWGPTEGSPPFHGFSACFQVTHALCGLPPAVVCYTFSGGLEQIQNVSAESVTQLFPFQCRHVSFRLLHVCDTRSPPPLALTRSPCSLQTRRGTARCLSAAQTFSGVWHHTGPHQGGEALWPPRSLWPRAGSGPGPHLYGHFLSQPWHRDSGIGCQLSIMWGVA